jgi:hypothetical protein
LDPIVKSVAVPRTRRRAAKILPAAAPSPVTESTRGEVRVIRRRPGMNPAAAAPLYRVGERVTLLGGGNRWARVQSECRVLAVLPHENGPFQYRVRSEAENYERVVVESDLAPPG